MKSLLAIVGCILLLSPMPVMAKVCSEYGKVVGTACGADSDDGSGPVNIERPFSICSIDASSCSYQDCDGRCVCATNGVCPTSSSSSGCGDVSCESNPSWNIPPSLKGVQTGTVSLLNKTTCKCEDVIVQRCAAGYYVTAATNLSGYDVPYIGYFAKSVTCSACPAAEGDTSFYRTVPTYVTSDPSATRSFTGPGACRIKANTDIPDSTGNYQYNEPCTHSPEHGGLIIG